MVVEEFLEVRGFWIGQHSQTLTVILTDAIIGIGDFQLFTEISRLQVSTVDSIA